MYRNMLLLVVVLGGSAGSNPGICVVEKCAKFLLACEIDPICRKWSGCNQKCGLGDDALKCQIRCGDLYNPGGNASDFITAFSECVISENHCVPQTHAKCPTPSNAAALPDFNLDTFAVGTAPAEWYITLGLNPLFDCFDCQHHTFSINSTATATPGGKPLVGDLRYKVRQDLNCTPGVDCVYLDREVHQAWSQSDVANKGHLANHNNTLAELHYADDWYVLSARAAAYVLVYYCGCNDASCGYSGAFLYTASEAGVTALEPADVAAIQKAVAAAGIDGWDYSTMCKPSYEGCT